MKNRTQALCSFQNVLRTLVLLAFVSRLYAQSESVLGTSVNLTGGFSNRARTIVSQPTGNSFSTSFYGIYPSFNFTSLRESSSLTANYAFGFNRTVGSSALPTGSHTASLNYSKKLSSRWSVGLSDSFRVTDGLGTFNALGGTLPQSNSLIYSFQSVSGRRFPRTNNVDANLDYALDSESTISITARHSIRKYGSGGPSNALLANRQQVSGSVGFQQRLGTRESWGLTYSGTYFSYGNSQSSVSHSAETDYSLGVGTSMTLRIGAGVSQVNSSFGVGKLNYDALVSLAKTVQSDNFSLSFTQSTTDRVGLGGASMTRRASLNWNRAFGLVTTSATLSAYRKGSLSNPPTIDGVTTRANVGFPITRALSVSAGGHFHSTKTGSFGFNQRRAFYTGSVAYAVSPTLSFSVGTTYENTQETGVFDFMQKRVFLSLRYSEPSLLRLK